MILTTLLLGIFAANGLVNVIIAMLVIIFLGGIMAYFLNKAGPFEMKTAVWILCAVILVGLFLWFVGAFPV